MKTKFVVGPGLYSINKLNFNKLRFDSNSRIFPFYSFIQFIRRPLHASRVNSVPAQISDY